MASLSAISRVLAQRNLRIFYSGSLASWTGLWVQKIAVDWMAWELTHSPLWVGILAFCNLAPSVIVSPFAGAWADRVDRVRLTVITQYITAGHALVLAGLAFTGLIRVEYIAALEVLLGSAQAFAQPARQSLVPGMVARGDLPGAVALNSLTYNLARSIGPGIGGLVVAFLGPVPAILANATAYVFATTTMRRLVIDPAYRRGHPPTGSVLREIADGFRYVARHPGMGPLFLFAAALGILVRPVPEMLPPFVDMLFGRGSEGLAILASAGGLAALCGGMFVAVRGRLTGLVRLAVLSGLITTVATAGFVATGNFAFAVLCSAVIGGTMTVHGISASTLMQSGTSSQMLGRVIGLWSMINRAAPALGAVLFGLASEWVGLRIPVFVGCGLALVACVWAVARMGRMARALERPEG